ncbi:MAG: toxin-antitoxin system [Proteobacteria bacterium]|nr:toxin-antitoxin system [Pseudomonadota bacterium]
MAQLVVRDVEPEVKIRLKQRAQKRGHSMEAEVRAILRAAVAADEAPAEPLGTRLRNRFVKVGFDEPVRELRGQIAQPVDLDT